MKYEIEQRDLEIEGTLPRVRLLAETPQEGDFLNNMEAELDSKFGRGQYVLQFSGKGPDPRRDGVFTLEYTIHKK